MTALRMAAWAGLLGALILAGCGGEAPTNQGPRPIFGDGLIDNSRVVATVDGEAITEPMLDLRIEELTASGEGSLRGPRRPSAPGAQDGRGTAAGAGSRGPEPEPQPDRGPGPHRAVPHDHEPGAEQRHHRRYRTLGGRGPRVLRAQPGPLRPARDHARQRRRLRHARGCPEGLRRPFLEGGPVRHGSPQIQHQQGNGRQRWRPRLVQQGWLHPGDPEQQGIHRGRLGPQERVEPASGVRWALARGHGSRAPVRAPADPR